MLMGTTDYSRPEPEVEAEVQALLENWIVTGQQRLVALVIENDGNF
jgi:hypothetical protein